MLTVQDDWIQYEATPARRPAVRGGAACAVRIPTASDRTARTPRVPVTVAAAVRPAPAGGGSSRSAARLRLTRRGRFVLVVLPALAALCGGSVLAVGAGEAEAATAPAPVRRVVVERGETLWGVAERVAPRRDPREVVRAIEAVNGLTGASVAAGDVLVLPPRG